MSAAPERLILRNTLMLVGAQIIAAPLAVLINAVAARALGPTDFGQLYLATTFSSLAFLFVEWGQPIALTGMVARDRSRAGELLGSGLALRSCLLPLLLLVLIGGCALFPSIGIDVFGRTAYDPAAANLRILAVFVLLLYLTMPLSATLLAAGRQRAWAAAQFGCVALSAALDPWLIPWFQARTGNGGLGVCISTVGGEMLMVAAGLYLLPRGIFERSVWRGYASVAAAGAAMAGVAFALSRVTPYAAAPAALLAYAACLWFTGGKSQIDLLRSLLRRKPAQAP